MTTTASRLVRFGAPVLAAATTALLGCAHDDDARRDGDAGARAAVETTPATERESDSLARGDARAVASPDAEGVATARRDVLVVRVTGVASTDAPIHVGVFDEDGWLGSETVASGEAAATTPVTIVTIEGLVPGRYGVSLFQDETGDGALDRGRFSVPAEPFGFSSGARIRFGPPGFDAAAFAFEGGRQEIEIPLQPALVPRED